MAEDTRAVPTSFPISEYEKTMTRVNALGGAFSGLGGLISKATSLINPLNVAMGALGATLGGGAIMKAGSEFEDLQIGMAQTLRFMGQGGQNFGDALQNASVVMRQIVADAGPLPGNAMDYANALQVAGTAVNRATGDFSKTYELVKKTTAVSISMGGSAALGAAELNRMLDATHGMMHQFGDFNMKMLVAMRQLPGMANLTAHEFNKFDLNKRLDLVTKAMNQFDDQVQAASHTWTAIKGATEATTSLLVKSATAPLFEAAKKRLEQMNNSILQADGNFTPLGQRVVNIGNMISSGIVHGFDLAVHAASRLGAVLDRMGSSPLFNKLASLAPLLAGAAGAVALSRVGPGAAALGGAAAAHFVPHAGMGGMPGGELGRFAGEIAQVLSVITPFRLGLSGLGDALTRAGVAANIFGSVMTMFDALQIPLASLASTAAQATSIVGDMFAGVLPGLFGGLASLLQPIAFVVDAFNGVRAVLFDAVQPALYQLWQAVGALFSSIGDFLNPIIGVLGAAFIGAASLLGDVLGAAITTAAHALTWLATGLAKFLSWLGGLMGKAFADLGVTLPTRVQAHATSNVLGEFMDKLKNFGKGGAPAVGRMIPGGAGAGAGAMKPPEARGGGGRVVQDFRYSRFEINQKFQEGFDADRIAVAFAHDVGKLGEYKLQSGLEPAMAVR